MDSTVTSSIVVHTMLVMSPDSREPNLSVHRTAMELKDALIDMYLYDLADSMGENVVAYLYALSWEELKLWGEEKGNLTIKTDMHTIPVKIAVEMC